MCDDRVHIESIKRIIRISSENGSTCGVDDLVDVAIDRLIHTYTALSKGQWLQLRLAIMKYLQGKKVKVSLFLQQGMQALDGVLVLNNNGFLAYGAEIPGTIRYYDDNKCVSTRKFELGNDTTTAQILNEYFDTSSSLGLNLFSKEATSQTALTDKTSVDSAMAALSNQYSLRGSSSSAVGANSKASSGPNPVPASADRGSKVVASSAKAELTMLSDLLGLGLGSGSKEDHINEGRNFKVNLFPDTFASDSKDGDSGFIMIDIDASGSKSIDAYMSELGLKESKAQSKVVAADDEDDLLAMMDAASAK